jgi:hypothetical protein
LSSTSDPAIAPAQEADDDERQAMLIMRRALQEGHPPSKRGQFSARPGGALITRALYHAQRWPMDGLAPPLLGFTCKPRMSEKRQLNGSVIGGSL